MAADAWLTLPQNLRQLGHRQFMTKKQVEQAQARRFARCFQSCDNVIYHRFALTCFI